MKEWMNGIKDKKIRETCTVCPCSECTSHVRPGTSVARVVAMSYSVATTRAGHPIGWGYFVVFQTTTTNALPSFY
eukprot:scaffold3118_cov64-Cylindrotheca_fusiformis.AAC.16